MPALGVQILHALLIVAVALVLQRLAVRATHLLERYRWLPPTLRLLVSGFLRWAIWVAAALFLLELFGMPIRSLWAGILSVALLVAVAFVASWSVLSNILSAVLLLTFSRARLGDIVELKDTKQEEVGMRGVIVDINLFFVTLQELKPDLTISDQPPFTQIPCHMFFNRVTRCWRGNATQPLTDAFRDQGKINLPQDQ
jgi:small-conductance mechanosensitive channel